MSADRIIDTLTGGPAGRRQYEFQSSEIARHAELGTDAVKVARLLGASLECCIAGGCKLVERSRHDPPPPPPPAEQDLSADWPTQTRRN